MRIEKVIKRNDGSRIKIEVNLYLPSLYRADEKHEYNVMVCTCEKGKRTWKHIPDTGSGEEAIKLGLLVPDEIFQVKNELWEQIKPEL